MTPSAPTRIDVNVPQRALARERQERIVGLVRERGAVRVSDLVEQLGVSDMTVRRDLDTLAAAGQLDKVHGGATAAMQRSTEEPGFAAKSQRQLHEKAAIASAAAALIRPGSAIGITAGTTTWHLATYVASMSDLVVVTNSVPVADVLYQAGNPGLTVVLTGGVRTPSDALVGPVAAAALRSLHLDQVFLGVHGMSERAGFTTPNLQEADTNRAFLDAAQRLVVLADHTKWETRGLSTIAALHAANTLITDQSLEHDAVTTLRGVIADVIVAEPTIRSLTASRG